MVLIRFQQITDAVMDVHSRNDTARSAIIIETTCTETLSLSRRLSSVSSVSSVVFISPTPVVIPSPSVPGYVDTCTDTRAGTSSFTNSESTQQASMVESQHPSSTQGEDMLQQSENDHGSAAHSMGAHVGIGISVGLAVAALCLAAAWYWRRTQRRRKRKAAVVERPSPVGVIAELDGGWVPPPPPPPQRRRSTLRRSLRDSWYLVLQRNQGEDVPPLPKQPGEVDPEMSFLDLTPSETKSRRSISKT
ncbi:hypothetical protein F4775DRAFT_588356 [Biscogniauxia sp. FL1348]|nr:hypothetical protein F4775DRAFT_588356 [Biscogniauxia sp. FL1348]